jgi:hypothetical protein
LNPSHDVRLIRRKHIDFVFFLFFKKNFETQLEMEKSKTENDQKKLQALINEYSREKEEKRQLLRQESVSSSDNSDQQQQQVSNQFQTLFKQQQNLPVYDYLRNTGAINILENLQSRLKEKEGEIAQLQA